MLTITKIDDLVQDSINITACTFAKEDYTSKSLPKWRLL